MQLMQKTAGSAGAVLGKVVDTPVNVSTTGVVVQTAQETVWRLWRVAQTSSSTRCGRSEMGISPVSRAFFGLRPLGR